MIHPGQGCTQYQSTVFFVITVSWHSDLSWHCYASPWQLPMSLAMAPPWHATWMHCHGLLLHHHGLPWLDCRFTFFIYSTVVVRVLPFFSPPSHLLSSPFFSLSLLVVTQIRGHMAGSSPPLPTTVRALHFYREKISALSSLVESRRIVLIHARRSQQLILFKQKKSRSHHVRDSNS